MLFNANLLNILKQYKTSTVLDVDNFETFIKNVYNLFDNAKYAINTLIERVKPTCAKNYIKNY